MRQARKPILLSTLSFIGFVTCDRVLQSGIEELHYVERIARLRAYYFDFAPELTHYLASVPPSGRLAILGLRSGYWPAFRTTAGMIGVVTAVLTGSDAGLLATIAAGSAEHEPLPELDLSDLALGVTAACRRPGPLPPRGGDDLPDYRPAGRVQAAAGSGRKRSLV